MALPKYVEIRKGSYVYRPYLGRIDGKVKWGKRVRLGPKDMTEDEVWLAFTRAGIKLPERRKKDLRLPFPHLPASHKLNQAYARAKGAAKQRGIDWQFTKDEWYDWWGEDIFKRGNKNDELQMCRYGDEGPYHPDNVFKGEAWRNQQDGAYKAHLRLYGTESLDDTAIIGGDGS